MLAALRAQNSRPLCSLAFQSTSTFHTSASACAENSRKHLARAIKKANNLKKEERWRVAQATKPSIILGTRPGDESKWDNCDLAKILVDEKELQSSTELQATTTPVGTVYVPKQLGYGVGAAEKEILFRDLPVLSAQSAVLASANADPNVLAQEHQNGLSRELHKANAFAKVLDLRNASAGGIAYENRRRIIAEFSGAENPFDSGRSEVQAAILTYRIRNLWTHLTQFKRDLGNRRGLRKLVHQRAKILKYLKKTDRQRYDAVLERLALEPESVEGELVV